MIWRKDMPISSDTLDSWDEFDDEDGFQDLEYDDDDLEEELAYGEDWYWDGEEV